MPAIVDQLITRAKLAASHRIRKAYAGPVAGAYAHARSAAAKGLLLDQAEDIQAEADRVGALAAKVRRRVTITVDAGDYKLGDIVALTGMRYGLDNWQGMVIERSRDILRGTVKLTLWG